MGNQDNRPAFPGDLLQEIENNSLIRLIEVPCRFSGQDNGRLIDERPGHADTLLFPSRNLGGKAAGPAPPRNNKG